MAKTKNIIFRRRVYLIGQAINQFESRDSVNLLYGNSLAGVLVTLIAGSYLTFGFVTPELSKLKLFWWGILLICLAVRLADYLYWRKSLFGTKFDGKWALRRFILGALLTAAMWSSYIVFIGLRADVMELAFSVIVVSAMAGGSATVLAGSRIAALWYSGILLIPSSIALVMSGEQFQFSLGILGLFFGVVMLISSNRAVNFTKNAIHLKNHNSILIEEMKVEKREVGRVNQELNEAYSKLHNINSSLEEEVLQRTQKIQQLSNLDPLTQLYNRTAFTHALDTLIGNTQTQKEPLAILFIDLKGFKKINDALGHEIGDSVLKIITGRILTAKENGHIGRWGGDEFVLALPNLSVKQAVKKAQSVVKLIEKPFDIDNITLNVGASVGIAMSPLHGTEVKQLIQFADIAMYKNKNSKLNLPVVFSEQLLQAVQRTERLREGLGHALDRAEFRLVYQPIINAVDHKVAGCEVLLRWTFEGEEVSPVIFIPIAEQSSLIISIGEWVLRKACFDAKSWSGTSDRTLSVNVSMVQLLDDGFLKILDDILHDTQLPPERLILEITESIFTESKNKVAVLLKDIMSRRVRVSIDDFGTGYSSMSQLQALPFHIVKIDRSFVANINEKGGAIIRATLYIARELGCKTVAEGIETEEQAKELVSMGANYLQGFFYSKPINIDELNQFIKGFEQTEVDAV